MIEKQPYEFGEEWNDLPLPGEDASWQKMKELLDKEEKKRRVIPPIFLNCAGIALIIALIAGGAWLAFRPDGFLNRDPETKRASSEKNQSSASTKNPSVADRENASVKKPAATQLPPVETHNSTLQHNSTKNSIEVAPATAASGLTDDRAKSAKSHNTNTADFQNRQKTLPEKKAISKKTSVTTSNQTAGNRKKKSIPVNVVVTTNENKVSETPVKKDATEKISKTTDTISDKLITDSKPVVVTRTDSSSHSVSQTQTPVADSHPIKVDSAVTIETPVAIKKSKPSTWHFSAGLGIQQQLRNGNQISYAPDYYGKKGFFSEHIPSVYLRLHHKENWFVQGEFRFGAPQLVKDYSFARKTKYDTSSTSLVITSQRLRKLYYHQLPFSFNYNIHPRLSIGAGGVYSIFYRAVTEQEVRSTNVFTGAESYSTKTERIPGFRDSFLFKTQLQAIIQTDYQWKNFSLGLRYKRDLQPYIKYTTPDGIVTDETNDALEVILRYRLWKSRKK